MRALFVAAAIGAVVVVAVALLGRGGAQSALAADSPAPGAPAFANPEPVAIDGYSGPQQDPVVSPDGRYLFFDSHNDAGRPSYDYYAEHIDYKTFKFMGEVQGTNFSGQISISGAYDRAKNFYFTSTHFRDRCGMIARGVFDHGTVTDVARVKGICLPPPSAGTVGTTNGARISPDGNTLYYTEWVFRSGRPLPQSVRFAVATKNPDGSFAKSPDSDTIFKNINSFAPVVYNAGPTPDGLAFFFTAWGGHRRTPPAIYVATRASASEPFGMPRHVQAADVSSSGQPLPGRFSEGVSVSPDGKYLYYHRVLSPSTSQIYVMTLAG